MLDQKRVLEERTPAGIEAQWVFRPFLAGPQQGLEGGDPEMTAHRANAWC